MILEYLLGTHAFCIYICMLIISNTSMFFINSIKSIIHTIFLLKLMITGILPIAFNDVNKFFRTQGKNTTYYLPSICRVECDVASPFSYVQGECQGRGDRLTTLLRGPVDKGHTGDNGTHGLSTMWRCCRGFSCIVAYGDVRGRGKISCLVGDF